jgi:hypothetical protein
MGQAKREAERLEDLDQAIEAIAIGVGAFARDEYTDEVTSNSDEDADKQVYVKAFKRWARGKLDASAGEVFSAVEKVLEGTP